VPPNRAASNLASASLIGQERGAGGAGDGKQRRDRDAALPRGGRAESGEGVLEHQTAAAR
jgi:hypothetical protein